jgi:pyruvate kinase
MSCSAEDVKNVRKCLTEYGNTDIKIISKIERPQALKNLDEIIEASNGLMVKFHDMIMIPT